MVTEIHTGIPVDDFETARAWYEIFAGRPPDLAPQPGEAVWHIAGTGWIAVVADDVRAGSAILTLHVDDLESHVGFLAMRGVGPDSIETVPGRTQGDDPRSRPQHDHDRAEPRRRRRCKRSKRS